MKKLEEKDFMYSFIAGSVLGAGIALLLAPQRGEKTREDLKKITKDMKETVDLTKFVNQI